MAEIKIIASATAENTGAVYATELMAKKHTLVSDEPEKFGGADAGPDPGELVCMALASCTAITLRMYVNRKKWTVLSIKVKVNLVKDPEQATTSHTFFCELMVDGNLNENQKKRLREIANVCPIHKLLVKPTEVVTILTET